MKISSETIQPTDHLKQSYDQTVASIERISGVVDSHEVAMEILLNNNFVVPPFKFIRWRVFDALRAMARERKAATLYQENLQSFFQEHPDQPKLLEQLMELASLSQLEKEILFLRIYQDLSDEEISQHLHKPLQAIKSTAWVMMEKLKTAKRKIEVQNELDGKKGD